MREDRDDKVYKTAREKFQAIIEEITTLSTQGRPVLVGTVSVEISELLSKMLTLRKIKHQVLNAKHHQQEAEIIAEAGKASTVTIATNMAGRGTDIKLTPAAKDAGGLAIIGTERHESRRVDRQLRGRAGRQGDVGSSQFFVSLEDGLMRLFISDRIAKIMDRLGLKEGEMIQHKMITNSIERAQKKVEQNNYAYRERLLQYDNELNKQREIIYRRRRDALFGKKLRMEIFNMLQAIAKYWMTQEETKPNYEALKQKMSLLGGIVLNLTEEAYATTTTHLLTDVVYKALVNSYETKCSLLETQSQAIQAGLQEQFKLVSTGAFSISFSNGEETLAVSVPVVDFMKNPGETLIKALERATIIHYIDRFWQEHLRYMDELRQAVQHASYEQKDPLLIYKFESYKLFTSMVVKLNEAIISYFLRADLVISPTTDNRPSQLNKPTQSRALRDPVPDIKSTKTPLQITKPQKKTNKERYVSVQYPDGTIKTDVPYSQVAKDLNKQKCVIIDKMRNNR